MENWIKLSFLKDLEKAIDSENPLIQVVLGPRQVGKTTSVKMLIEGMDELDFHYESADGDVLKPSSWLIEQWQTLASKNRSGLLIIDEIQKVENWSETLKMLWDEREKNRQQLKVVVLGSSSLELQKGLSESLTGRFQVHRVFHWNAEESQRGYGIDLDCFLRFGGYPGSYRFLQDPIQWLNYLKKSIIEPVIGRDILSLHRVKSPALFRQCFELICSYPAQEISYTKLLGQLQEKGNTDLIKHYIELFEGAFLVKQLFKYSEKKVLQKTSSPKLLPMCPALYSVTLDADLNAEDRGRSFELVVGGALVRLPGQTFYWRKDQFEVDFVYRFGKRLVAIEVKSGRRKHSQGLERFKRLFPHAELAVFTPENFQQNLKALEPSNSQI